MQLDENQISLRAEFNGKEYYLVCPKESFLGELYDVIGMFKGHVLNAMQNADKSPEPEAKEE